MVAGAAVAFSLMFRVWEVRVGQERLCEAIEVFVLPAVLAFSPYIASTFSHGHSPSTASSALVMMAAASTFLVGFALIGVPASGVAAALALVRIPLDAVGLLLLKEGLSAENPALFLRDSVSTATTCSLLAIPVALFSSEADKSPSLNTGGIASLLLILLVSILSQLALLYNLTNTSLAISTASTLFPRNLLLLVWQSFGRESIPLRQNWMQVLLVYVFGTVGVTWADGDVWSAFVRWRKGGGDAYSLLSESNGHAMSPSGSPPPNLRKQSSDRTSPHSSRSPSLLSLLPFFPLLIHLLTLPVSYTSVSLACSYLPPSLRSTICPSSASAPTSRSVDLVIAYYDEALERTRDHINDVRKTPFVRKRSNRVVLYNKGPKGEEEIRKGLGLRWTDEVVPLPNLGREGATYLTHILLHYNTTLSSLLPSFHPSPPPASLLTPLSHLRTTHLADHTYFLQPHLAWGDIAAPRMRIVEDETGFAHFGPLIRGECGFDKRVDVDFPTVKELFNIFAGEMCPPTGHLMAWSAQFAVSKRRILANPYARYSSLSSLLEAPSSHWIHNLWGPNDSGGPSNPAFGHSVERAWPVIFGCWDPQLAAECPDEVAEKEKCQCLDT
ncbi:Proteophosphoglycan ppg4 [Rhodotorula toruloides ATCC 204091]|uniref:Proteophosphoglycan ppg4 n=1 Tax=Rhodotorula toruloides TaxID=5286 RepID=A0A0K3CGR1_RHOTO|nr:Proteophosphoglycan ppg4 [Rhodotorula toruloides ATCC 204091]PRQ76471.1 Proteophosphoglycan ppg4 [Rhodotorula toruloides]